MLSFRSKRRRYPPPYFHPRKQAQLLFAVKDKDSKFLFGATDSGKDMGEISLDFLEMFGDVDLSERPVTKTLKFDKWFKLELGGHGELHLAGDISFTFK